MSISQCANRTGFAAAAGIAAIVLVLAALGLFTGDAVAAGDNGDGWRLYCGAGLVPATGDGRSNWKGGVVVAFTRAARCPDPIPSSALLILRAAAAGHPAAWSLIGLGVVYALLFGVVTAAAAWAITARGLWWAGLLAIPLLPAAARDFVRFLISTYAEPAGLLGTYALFAGLTVITGTRSADRAARGVALALVAGGGTLAATAKLGYAPVLVAAAIVCVATPLGRSRGSRLRRHAAGLAATGCAVALAAGPLASAAAWADRAYPAMNAHDVVFTALYELGPSGTAQLGLPPAAAAWAGQSFHTPDGRRIDPDRIPGWRDAVGDYPHRAHVTAALALARHPRALARMFGTAVQATRAAELDYIPANPLPAAADPPTVVRSTPPVGWRAEVLTGWLNGMPFGWLPAGILALGLAAGALGLRARTPPVPRVCCRIAGVAAATALALAGAAALGDGYYELAKHVWLAAYLLHVVELALLAIPPALCTRRAARPITSACLSHLGLLRALFRAKPAAYSPSTCSTSTP